jgi:hypothetical protein
VLVFSRGAKILPKGGYRAGAGRKKGAATIRTRQIANELARAGETPLQLMINAMRELCQWAQSAPTTEVRIERTLAAVAVAEKAAPYIHPRLAAVAATVRQVSSVRDLSDSELVALIRSLGGDVIDGEAEQLALPAGGRDLN